VKNLFSFLLAFRFIAPDITAMGKHLQVKANRRGSTVKFVWFSAQTPLQTYRYRDIRGQTTRRRQDEGRL
jgi:hypothetical protein